MREWTRVVQGLFSNNLCIGRKTNLLWQKEESWESEHSRALITLLPHPPLSPRVFYGESHLDREERKTRKVLVKVPPFLLT